MASFKLNLFAVLGEYSKSKDEKTVEALQLMYNQMEDNTGIGSIVEMAITAGVMYGINHKDEITEGSTDE